MKSHLVSYVLFATIPLQIASLTSVCSAQNRPPVSKTAAAMPTPRSSDGHPNLDGFWVASIAGIPTYHEENPREKLLTRSADGSTFFDYGGSNAQGNGTDAGKPQRSAEIISKPSYKPEYAAKVKAILATMYGSTTSLDPQQACKPNGVPRQGVVSITGVMQIVQNSQATAILYEASPGPVYRIVYTDGRAHPKDLDTSYLGDSIGHWDGDAFVTDVVGLNDETWLGGGAQAPRTALIHSDQEHVIERWTRQGNALTYEATVEDPVMFAKPWVITPQHTQLGRPGDYMQPQMCFARDRDHLVKPTETDQFTCGWCQKDPNAIYGTADSAK
jgi:hypothetical protein